MGADPEVEGAIRVGSGMCGTYATRRWLDHPARVFLALALPICGAHTCGEVQPAGDWLTVQAPVQGETTRCRILPGDSVTTRRVSPEPWLRLTHGAGVDDPLFHIADALLFSDAVYVINAQSEILKYSRDGEFLGRAGRRGEGPGEFMSALDIDAYRGDSLVVFDRSLQRISVWSRDLELGRTTNLLRLSNPWRMVGAFADGSVAVRANEQFFVRTPTRDTAYVVLYDAHGMIRDTSSRIPHTISFLAPFGAELRPGEGPFSGQAWFAASEDELFMGSGGDGRIWQWNTASDQVATLAVDCSPASVAKEVIARYKQLRLERGSPAEQTARRRFLDQVPFPLSVPVFERLIVSDDGDIWIAGFPGVSDCGFRRQGCYAVGPCRATALRSRRSRPLVFARHAALDAERTCSAISLPWSQVSERLSCSALHARYRPLEPVAATSREIVEGALPRRPAIARHESPALRPREISSRSATVRWCGERFRPRGASPPVRINSRWTDLVEHPTAAATSACVSPLLIRSPISSWSASLSLPYSSRRRIAYLPAIQVTAKMVRSPIEIAGRYRDVNRETR